jgi:steroid delta-isomerase-like uncharacterized protein
MPAEETIQRYYAAFNQKNMKAFLDMLTDDVVHEINENGTEVGKTAFEKFMARMNRCYEEKVVNLVIFSSSQKERAAAEFIIEGKYLQSDQGLPEAKGQTYRIPCGAFFTLKNDKVSRVTTYYNLKEWIRQVT